MLDRHFTACELTLPRIAENNLSTEKPDGTSELVAKPL